jgi:hypothetical protein
MLTVSATADGERWSVRGTVLQNEAVIVGVNDLWVDFPATGNLLLSSHQDKPGIIGRIGMMLGESDINISFMHVGRNEPRTDAIMVLGTDEIVPPEMIEQLSRLTHISWLKAVTL